VNVAEGWLPFDSVVQPPQHGRMERELPLDNCDE
jgi:hypothetical protein